MKNVDDDRFDDELKSRLGNYTEEPDDALWQGIATGISSAPAGLDWLRWVSRGFLMSFAVVTMMVGDSRFMVQGSGFAAQDSRLDGGEQELVHGGNSKFNPEALVQDSTLAYGRVAVACEDFEGNEPRLAEQHEGDSEIKVQIFRVKEVDGVKGGNGRSRMAAGVSKVDMRRLKTGRAKSKIRNKGLRSENDLRAVARPSSTNRDDGSTFVVAQSEREGEKLNAKDRRSKAEAGERVVVDRRSNVSEDDGSRVDARRSKLEERRAKIEVPRSVSEGEGVKFEIHRSISDERTSLGASTGEHGVTAGVTSGKHNGIAQGAVVSRGAGTGVSRNEDALREPSDDGMDAVYGPPLFMRSDTLLGAQQGMKRTVEAEMIPVQDSTKEVNHLAKRRAARDAILKKESDEKRNDRPLRRTSLYFTAMPTLGYQRIEANPSDNIIVESFQKVSNFSSKRLGVRAEFGAEYTLTPRVKVFGGVLYYQRKQTINYVERVSTGVEQHTSGDTLTLDPQFSLEDKAFEYELKNIGVQLGVNYVLWKKKFLHVAGTGIEFHKALNKLGEAQKLQGFSTNPSTYVFYNLYYRVQYPAEGRLKAIFQPTLNYSLFLNRNMNAPFYVKPYGLGLNLGLTYNF